MVKITGSPVRVVALLAGIALAIAGVLVSGGPAVAGRAAGRPGLRAEALAQVMRHGVGFRPGGVGAAALPGDARNVPRPGKHSALNGVYCTSPGNCWAVGEYGPIENAEANEVLHWNGRKWSQVPVTSPGGTGTGAFSDLFAVRCTSAGNCWAVGYYDKGETELNQALHWNGKKWSRVFTPTPGGTLTGAINELFDINCTSSASCLADGEYGSLTSTGETILNQVLRWNGRTWSVAPTPDPAGTALGDVQAIDAIRCGSASNCIAVGTQGTFGSTFELQNEALHWNGSKWSTLSTPNPGGTSANGDVSELAGLGCSGASTCFAAGTYGNLTSGTMLNQVLRWNGKKWSLATTPDPGGTGTHDKNELFAVSCLSATSCWAVGLHGFDSGGSGTLLNEALRWNGKTWSLVKTPSPAGTGDQDTNELNAIRCASPGKCFAVGEQQKKGGPEQNEILRWNGSRWSTS